MKQAIAAVVLLLVAPAAVTAQTTIQDCPECVLGLWDDVEMTRDFGTIEPLFEKDIFLGVQFGAGQVEIQGIEFSIAGMADEIYDLDAGPDPRCLRVGPGILAPADTSASSTGQGGLRMWLENCLRGDQALLEIRLLAFGVADVVLRVKRKYPPGDSNLHTAAFTTCVLQCDCLSGQATTVRAREGAIT